MSCWLDACLVHAKRGQDKQINVLERQSVKKARNFEIGENILLKIAGVDKRSPFDPPSLLGVILSKTDEDYYKLGTVAGILDSQYISTQFDMCQTTTLTPDCATGFYLRSRYVFHGLGLFKDT